MTGRLTEPQEPVAQLTPPNFFPHHLLPPINKQAADRPHAGGAICKVYPHGIEFIDHVAAMHGYALVLGAMLLAGSLFMLHTALLIELDWGVAAAALLLIWCWFLLRVDLVGFRYRPVLFDRANRKVHVFSEKSGPGLHWLKLWGKVAYRVSSYDWDCIRGEVIGIRVAGGVGGLPRQEYGLNLAVTDAPGSQTALMRFGVGTTSAYDGGAIIVARWEHIRRYMQQDGPPIASGDSLFLDNSRESLWAAITWMQPLLGPGAKESWTGESFNGAWFLTIPFGLLTMTLLPASVIAGLLRYVGQFAKAEPRWPRQIQESVGAPLSVEEIEVLQYGKRSNWTRQRKAAKLARQQGKSKVV